MKTTKYLTTKMIDGKWYIIGLSETEKEALEIADSSHVDKVFIYNFPSDIEASYFIQGIEHVNDYRELLTSLQPELLNKGQVIIFENLFFITDTNIKQLKEVIFENRLKDYREKNHDGELL